MSGTGYTPGGGSGGFPFTGDAHITGTLAVDDPIAADVAVSTGVMVVDTSTESGQANLRLGDGTTVGETIVNLVASTTVPRTGTVQLSTVHGSVVLQASDGGPSGFAELDMRNDDGAFFHAEPALFGIFDKGGDTAVQQNHVAHPVGGTTIDTQARAAINEISDLLAAYGWTKAT